MKRLNLRSYLPIILIIIISVVALIFDILKFYSSVDIRSWSYIHETLAFVNMVVYYFYLRKRDLFKETDVKTIIKNFGVLLIALYIFVLLNKQFFLSEFSGTIFPPEPDNISSLIYANSISLAAILFFIPMLLLIRNLINYKYKKLTKLYLGGAIGLTGFLMVWTAIFNIAPDISFDFNITDTNSIIALVSNSAFMLSLLFFILLSTRTNWVTHLRKREKASFFVLSAILIWLIIYLYGFAFDQAVPAHSIVLGIFTNSAWLFLTFYSMMAGLNLMMHLPTARIFDRKMNEIASLHDLSRAISVDADFHTIVHLVIEMSADVLETNFTWLEVYNKEEQTSKVTASDSLTRAEISALSEHSNHFINNQIYDEKEVVVINEFTKDSPYLQIKSWKNEIESMAGVPIIGNNGNLFGILYTAKTKSYGFDPDDVNLLEAYANQAAIAFENAELMAKSLERERMEQELQIAREVQMRLLPQDTVDVPGLLVETLTITAYEVGGDYYDFYSISDHGMGLIIGDVSGKGASAAFYMAETKGIILSLAETLTHPAEILKKANKILYPSMEKKAFISMLAARWDADTKILHFARAGHCPVIHYSAALKNTILLQPPGLAIGLDEGRIFDQILKETEHQTAAGDILAFYTDGLSEARNKQDEEFGEQRLCDVIRENAHLDVEALKQAIIDTILSFLDGQALHDDLTLVLLKINTLE